MTGSSLLAGSCLVFLALEGWTNYSSASTEQPGLTALAFKVIPQHWKEVCCFNVGILPRYQPSTPITAHDQLLLLMRYDNTCRTSRFDRNIRLSGQQQASLTQVVQPKTAKDRIASHDRCKASTSYRRSTLQAYGECGTTNITPLITVEEHSTIVQAVAIPLSFLVGLFTLHRILIRFFRPITHYTSTDCIAPSPIFDTNQR